MTNETLTTRNDGEQATAVTIDSVNAAVKVAIDGLVKNQLPGAINAAVGDRFSSVENLIKSLKPEPAATPVATTTDKTPVVSPETQAAMLEEKRQRQALELSVQNLTNKNAAAEAKADQAERSNAIANELSKFEFVSPKARESAAKLIALELKRTDDGQLIAGDNLPVESFINDFLTVQNDHLLAGKVVPGTGATKGNQRITNTAVGLESIVRGMTPETRTAVLSQIKAALPTRN